MSAKREAYEREVQKTKLHSKQALQLLHTDTKGQTFGKELNIKWRAQDLLLLKGTATPQAWIISVNHSKYQKKYLNYSEEYLGADKF